VQDATNKIVSIESGCGAVGLDVGFTNEGEREQLDGV